MDSIKKVYDAAGKEVTVGCIVDTLGVEYLKKNLSSTKDDSTIMKIAKKTAIVHDIVSEVKVYIEVLGEKGVVTLIPANCIVLTTKSLKVQLGDGTVACVGFYVKISEKQGTNWVHGMNETCQKTGKIVRITTFGDILVQFAWGPRFYYKTDDLSESHLGDIVTQDRSRKWIQVGSIAKITDSPAELMTSQQNNRLTYNPELIGQYVTVKKIITKAFSSSKIIQVSHHNNSKGDILSFVHAESLFLVDTFMDKEGQVIQVPGDRVRLCENEEQIKIIQGTKEWDNGMKKCFDIPGVATQLSIFSGSLRVKVHFYGDIVFNFKPQALILHTDKDDDELYSKTIRPWNITEDSELEGITSSTTLEIIAIEHLSCGQIIGKGSFGSVCRGSWYKNEKWNPVAIKKIEIFEKVEASAVWTEADTQHSLRHPNIVRMYGIHEEPYELWVIMDLIDGTDLFTLLFENTNPEMRLDFEQKRKLCLDMCNAIAYIHQRQYTHCDIKPQNMMVDRKHEKLFICDFGITRFVGEVNMNTMMMRYTKEVIGSPAYIAPECYQYDEATEKFPSPTYASDVWAMGNLCKIIIPLFLHLICRIVLFEMFTEKLFCDGGMRFLSFIMSNCPELVNKRILLVTENIRPIIAKTLNFEPRLRPTAQQLCEFFHELSSEN